MYLVYDVRGIQKYIFAVPKLKSIVGGSLLIDEFDSITARNLAEDLHLETVFTGGGRGLFQSNSEDELNKFTKKLVEQAHKIGLDLRIGKGPEEDGMPEAVDLYPFQPEIPEGAFPCALSGLWPVKSKDGIHGIIQKRQDKAKELNLANQSETKIKRILGDLNATFKEISESHGNATLVFFRNVTSESGDSKEELEEALASERALGNRKRWAVVCMDGNDMGLQIKKTLEQKSQQQAETTNWFRNFSKSLAECTEEAFQAALEYVVGQWLEKERDNLDSYCFQLNGQNYLVLPFRPLILGGDDVTILCHSSYAMAFVEKMSLEFEKISREKAKKISGLWPATNGKLTISGGVLFCKTSFPLAMAIEYADALLANAKSSFRTQKEEGEPTPAAVDWETVTETLVDSPAERRRREMFFKDPDLDGLEIHLTQKPYTLGKLNDQGDFVPGDLFDLYEKERAELDEKKAELDEKKNVPRSLRSSLLNALHQPWSLRAMFLASIGKRHKKLTEYLAENPDDSKTGSWWTNDDKEKIRKTRVIDAITLLDEGTRMTQNTVGKSKLGD